MFAFVAEKLYVASPQKPKAIKLLRLQHDGKIAALYLAIIVPICLGFFLFGPFVFALLLAASLMTLKNALLSIVLVLLGMGGGFAMKKAGYAIAQTSQANKMTRYIKKGYILELPRKCSDEFVLYLDRHGCLSFLPYYHPTPYNFEDLAQIVAEIKQGSQSDEFFVRRVNPALHRIADQICANKRTQEEAHTQVAEILDELPRPDSNGDNEDT